MVNETELVKIVFLRLLLEIYLIIHLFRNGVVRINERLLVKGCVFLLWLWFCSVGGLNPKISLIGSYFRQQGYFSLSHLVFLAWIVSGNGLNRVWLSWWVSAGAICLAIASLVGKINLVGNGNFLGGYLVMALPFGVYLIRKNKWMVLVVMLEIMGIIFSGSETALALLTIGAIVFLGEKIRLKKIGWLMAMVVLGWAMGRIINNKNIFENRWEIWKKGVEIIRMRPVLGWGLENFELAYKEVVKENDWVIKDWKVDKAHNEVLEMGMAGGVVAIFLWLWVTAGALIVSKSGDDKDWLKVLRFSLGFFLIRSLVNPLSIAEMALGWIAIGESYKTGKTVELKTSRAMRVLLILGLLAMMIINLRMLAADWYFKKGIREMARMLNPWSEVY